MKAKSPTFGTFGKEGRKEDRGSPFANAQPAGERPLIDAAPAGEQSIPSTPQTPTLFPDPAGDAYSRMRKASDQLNKRLRGG